MPEHDRMSRVTDSIGRAMGSVSNFASDVKTGLGSAVRSVPIVGKPIEHRTHRVLKSIRKGTGKVLDKVFPGRIGRGGSRRKKTRKNRKSKRKN
jgi:hypothetical protein